MELEWQTRKHRIAPCKLFTDLPALVTELSEAVAL